MSKLQAGASAPVLKNKKGSPVPEGRDEAARKLLLSTKNREARSLFSTKLVIGIIVGPDGSPRPSGTGPIWKSSVTGAGAEAPAYYQGGPPDFAKAWSGRPGRYV